MTRLRGGEWTAFLILVSVVSYQIFVPPIVGLANNADFAKAVGVFNLAHPLDDEYKYVTKTYDIDPQRYSWWGLISSEQVLAGAAVLLNSAVRKDGRFDIRIIGALHAALYLGAFYLLLPVVRKFGRKRRFFLYGLLIVVFGDVMYVSLLDTFYMDAAALVFLVLAVVLYARFDTWHERSDWVAFVVCTILLSASKTQHAVLGLPLVCLTLLSWPAYVSKRWRGIAAFGIAAASAATLLIQPREYSAAAAYSVIFTEILPHSKDADRDLAELGLDDSFRQYIGTHAFSQESPMVKPAFVREFQARTSYGRIAYFYLQHPARAYRAIRHSLDFAGRQRPPLGNFDRSAGLPPSTESQAFSFWSGLKRRIFEMRGSRYLFFFLVACCACCIAVGLRHARFLAGAACLCSLGLIALLVGALADAVEITRHLFLFNAIADVILVCGIAAVTGTTRSEGTADSRARHNEPARIISSPSF